MAPPVGVVVLRRADELAARAVRAAELLEAEPDRLLAAALHVRRAGGDHVPVPPHAAVPREVGGAGADREGEAGDGQVAADHPVRDEGRVDVLPDVGDRRLAGVDRREVHDVRGD